MNAQIKAYADTLYDRDLMNSINQARDEQKEYLGQLAARRLGASTSPVSGPEIQNIIRLRVAHVGRCLTARLQSYRQAFDRAKQSPTDSELTEILGSVKETREREAKSSEGVLQRYIQTRGGCHLAGVNSTIAQMMAHTAHEHDRVLRDWKVWRDEIRVGTIASSIAPKTNGVNTMPANKPFIFVSCGQSAPNEIALGKQIVELAKNVTECDAFFAETQHDLAGLHSNILDSLQKCSAFIAVLHPRGDVIATISDVPKRVRASVWIEQEIAIATYIQYVGNHKLPVIAFIHESIDREGIRDLINLNPIKFKEDSEILDVLAERLKAWKNLGSTGVQVRLKTAGKIRREDHLLRQIEIENTKLLKFPH